MIEKDGYFYVHKSVYNMNLNPKELVVFIYFLSLMGANTVSPTRETISRKCGIGSTRTVDKTLKALVEKDLITHQRQGPMTPNRYTINFSKLHDSYRAYEKKFTKKAKQIELKETEDFNKMVQESLSQISS
jgi:hypothetical protein